MAVEKSHARLGLFLVVVARRSSLATAVLFIQRWQEPGGDRDGDLHHGERQRTGCLEPGAVQGRAGRPRHRAAGGPARRSMPSRSTSRCSSTVSTPSARTSSCHPAHWRLEGMFPKLRAQVVGNPVTGEAYLLLDRPKNPPPPLELGFKPDRAYIPSMPTTLVGDTGPACRRCSNARKPRCRCSRTSSRRIPDSLDRSDRFFTTVERIVQQSNLPALSADSRKFFATTAGRSSRSTTEHRERVIGDRGNAGDARRRGACRDQGRRSASDESGRPRRGGPDEPRGRRPAALAAGDPRLARTAARPRAAVAGAAGVGGLRSPSRGGEDSDGSAPLARVVLVLLVSVCLAGAACQLKRPETIPARMLEPQLLDPALPEPAEPGSTRAAKRRPSGCSTHRHVDTLAADCSTSNRPVS